MTTFLFATDSTTELYYKQPANNWNEAIPLGNGRLGAMVFGTVAKEKIELNEDTLWTGGPHNYNCEGGAKYLPQIRELLKQEKFEEARLLGDKHMMGTPKNQQAYQSLGALSIDFGNPNEFKDYRRSLDMSTGITSMRYLCDGVTYERNAFISYPDQVMVIQLSCNTSEKLSLKVLLHSPHPYNVKGKAPGKLILEGQVSGNETAAVLGEWKGEGTRFADQIEVLDTDGNILAGDDGLTVKNAKYATLLFTAATAYQNPKDVSGDPAAKCRTIVKAASKYSYNQLLERHILDHKKLFDRVTLELEDKTGKNLPTDKRITAMKTGQLDPFLTAQAFQFGRYLLMASSRPGSQPANLQGIWNNTLRPMWGSKWTLNINAPMNYWPVESCNLAECHQPLFHLLEGLREPGRETAKEYYDCKGFVVHHNTDLWRATAVADGYYYGCWPMGAGWLCTHLWEHYQFAGDKEFLKKAYSTIKESVDFFLDYLIKDENGYWVTSPAISFEQGFITKDGTEGRVCVGPTMDMQILRALFTGCIEASSVLNEDPEYRSTLISVRDNLAPSKVNEKTGRLQEWRDGREPFRANDGQLGHLWGVCPGDEITPFKTPELAAGAEKSMRHRGYRLGSWTSGKILNYWARLHNPVEYEKTLNAHMSGYVLPNMMSCFFNDLFQVDGNLGMTASVAEALIQSHAGEIHLLPALPKSWDKGSVSGLCARGGFECDLAWEDGELTKATIVSKNGNSCVVSYKGKQQSFETKAGKEYTISF